MVLADRSLGQKKQQAIQESLLKSNCYMDVSTESKQKNQNTLLRLCTTLLRWLPLPSMTNIFKLFSRM